MASRTITQLIHWEDHEITFLADTVLTMEITKKVNPIRYNPRVLYKYTHIHDTKQLPYADISFANVNHPTCKQ